MLFFRLVERKKPFLLRTKEPKFLGVMNIYSEVVAILARQEV